MRLIELLREEKEIKGKIRLIARVLKSRFRAKALPWLPRLHPMTTEELETVMTRFLEKKSLQEIFEGFESQIIFSRPPSYSAVDDIHNPHDNLFQDTYSRRYCAIALLRSYLPRPIARKMDFQTWELVRKSYIDDKLKSNESDLVYKIKYGGQDTWVYLLFEHQSTEDPMMPFRLLCYMINLWKELLKEKPKLKKLPPLFSMVLSHDRFGWKVSTHFQDILDIPESERKELKPYIPDFEHILVDLSRMNDEEIQGEVYGRLVLYLMKAASEGILIETVEKHAPLINELLHQKNSVGLLKTLLRYALSNISDPTEQEKLQQLLISKINPRTGKTMTSIAEQLVQKGKNEGRSEGRSEGAAGIIARGLKKRFKEQATPWLAKLQSLKSEQLEIIMDRIMENKSLQEIFEGV